VAWAAAHTRNTYFAAQFRRIAAKRRKERAILAVGHAILVTIYAIVTTQQGYQELSMLTTLILCTLTG